MYLSICLSVCLSVWFLSYHTKANLLHAHVGSTCTCSVCVLVSLCFCVSLCLALLPSCSLALLPSSLLALSSLSFLSISFIRRGGSANEAPRNATLSHEMAKTEVRLRFNILRGNSFARNEVRSVKSWIKIEILKCRSQPLTKWGSIGKNWCIICDLTSSAATLWHEMMFPGHHLLILKQKSISFIDFELGFFKRKQGRKLVENQ